MHYLTRLPFHINASLIFGLLLLLGLIGGELARKSRFLTRIFGYIIVGFLIGPGGFNVVNQPMLDQTRIFVDISLGLILFDLGRRLDFKWLRHDPGLLSISLVESTLTFGLILTSFLLIGQPWLIAALAATIAVVTSPAVGMLVAFDLSAKGPVTRRARILTSLNNLYGLVLFTLILPMAEPGSISKITLLFHIVYQLSGAVVTAACILILTKGVARLTGKNSNSQFILFIGSTILAIGLARLMHLSTMLTLFIFGVAARNFDSQHVLSEIDFGGLARIFLILLFVLTGISLRLHSLWQEAGIIITFILIRSLAKFAGIYLFAKSSRLTRQQNFSLSLALMPMAGVAIGMSYMLNDLNPNLGNSLSAIIGGALAILTLLGPVAMQFALLTAGEAPGHIPEGEIL